MSALLDSALINDQLVPIFPSNMMNPSAAPGGNPGAGAGTTTLPGNYMAGSAVQFADPSSPANASGDIVNTINQSMQSGSILGIPAVAFWVIVFAMIGYAVLKIVHFHSVVEADSSV